jgi:hypothetical protein
LREKGIEAMAEDEKQELTPEERLLEVIQKGDIPLGTGSVTASAAGLTLGDDSDGQPVDRAPSASVSAFFEMNTYSYALALVVLVLLACSGYEVYRNLPEPPTQYSASEIDIPEPGTLVMASLSDTLEIFSKRRITGIIPKPYVPPEPPGGSEDLKGWRAFVRDNWKLLGTSEVQRETASGEMEKVREAIVMDTKDGKMHLLTTGQTLVLSNQEVHVGSVDETTVDLVSGKETLTVK